MKLPNLKMEATLVTRALTVSTLIILGACGTPEQPSSDTSADQTPVYPVRKVIESETFTGKLTKDDINCKYNGGLRGSHTGYAKTEKVMTPNGVKFPATLISALYENCTSMEDFEREIAGATIDYKASYKKTDLVKWERIGNKDACALVEGRIEYSLTLLGNDENLSGHTFFSFGPDYDKISKSKFLTEGQICSLNLFK